MRSTVSPSTPIEFAGHSNSRAWWLELTGRAVFPVMMRKACNCVTMHEELLLPQVAGNRPCS